MSDKPEPNEIPEHPSVADMQDWLRQEIMDITKAAELRMKQATGLAIAYAKGELTPEVVSDRLSEYENRWGDALRGASSQPHLTDEDILKKIDWSQKMFGPRQGWRELPSWKALKANIKDSGPSENQR